jgi:hypothetical protein
MQRLEVDRPQSARDVLVDDRLPVVEHASRRGDDGTDRHRRRLRKLGLPALEQLDPAHDIGVRGGLRPGAVGVVDRGRPIEPHDHLDVVRQQPLGVRSVIAVRLVSTGRSATCRRCACSASAPSRRDGAGRQRCAAARPARLQLEGQGRRRALQGKLDDAFRGFDAHVGAAAVATAVGARGRAAPRERDDVDVRAAPHVAVALRDPRRQRVEIESVADDSLALEVGEARVPLAPRGRRARRRIRPRSAGPSRRRRC